MVSSKAEQDNSRLTTTFIYSFFGGCFSGVRIEYLCLPTECINNRMDSPIGIKGEVMVSKMTPKV